MEILLKSLLAAVVTAIILTVEKYAGPRISGAIAGIPIVFAISFVLLTYQQKDIAQITDFLWGGMIGTAVGILFALALIYLNKNFIEHYWLNFAGVYILCFVLSLVLTQYFTK